MSVFKSDREVLRDLASFFKRSRVNLQLTQKDIVERTGLDRGVISRFENEGNISLSNFLLLMRSVNKLELIVEMISQERKDPRIYKDKEIKRVRKSKNEPSKGFFME